MPAEVIDVPPEPESSPSYQLSVPLTVRVLASERVPPFKLSVPATLEGLVTDSEVPDWRLSVPPTVKTFTDRAVVVERVTVLPELMMTLLLLPGTALLLQLLAVFQSPCLCRRPRCRGCFGS